MSLNEVEFQELVDFYDHVRIPLSGMEREKRQGPYRYYGAQSVIDHVDDFIFDGEYVLIAEDGANLVTRNEPIAQVVSGQFWVNNHAHIVQAKEGVSTNNFINFLINTNNISGYVTGAAQPKLSQKNLRVIKFEVPSYEDQIAIDELISKYDDLIENNKRRIELLEESARQLYKEWFVRFRFPGHEHVKILDGVPEGWTKKPLKNVLTLNYGKALKADTRIPGDIPVYGSSGEVGKHNKALVKGPGIVVGRKGNVGSVFWVHSDFFPIDTVYFVTAEESDFFIYYALLHTTFINTDVAVPGLNRDMAYSREILIPSDLLRQEFLDEVTPIFEQCNVLSKYNNQLASARDLLLPKLMNGEITI